MAGRPQGRAGQAGETMSPGWPGRKRQGGLSFPAQDTAPLTLTLTTTRIAKVCKHSNYFAFLNWYHISTKQLYRDCSETQAA